MPRHRQQAATQARKEARERFGDVSRKPIPHSRLPELVVVAVMVVCAFCVSVTALAWALHAAAP